MRRIFVVGCPRSGTTLLQSFLAAHPDVHAFPETHFLYRIRASGRRRHAAGLASTDSRDRLRRVAELLGRDGDAPAPTVPTVAGYVRAFVRLADAAARERGRDAWVEKTPANLYALDLLERWVPDARILHSVRDGPDTVASLCAVAPEWGTSYTVDGAIDQWLECRDLTAARAGDPAHLAVDHERLARAPEPTLREVCAHVGLGYDPAMIEHRAAAARGLVHDFEDWKRDNLGPLRHQPRRRFEETFDADTRRYVEGELARRTRHVARAHEPAGAAHAARGRGDG